ncbi:MAG: hypothetical protein NNA25_00270 [Nitrospira sp.]|nr:hypothetical protein [Nitrospira sp.]
MDIEVGSNLYRNSDGTIMIDGVPHLQIARHPATGALLVNFALFDEHGRMLAKVVDSALVFNERRAYSLNKAACLVSMTEAATGKCVFQIETDEQGPIRFSGGSFYTMKGRLLEVSDKEWKIGKLAKSNQTIDANGGPVMIG